MTVLGVWSEASGGFTPAGKMSVNRMFPVDLEAATRKVGASPITTFIIALVFFLGLHAILVPAYFLGKANRKADSSPSVSTPTPEPATPAPRPTSPPADERVTVETGRPLADDSPALATIKEYLAAVNEGNLDAMARLVPGSSRTSDLGLWRSMRPREVREAGGYENDEAATIRVEGPSPKDPHRVVMFNLKKTFEGWRIYREWFPQDE